MAVLVVNRFNVFEFLVIATITTVILLIFKYYYNKRNIFKLGSKLPGPRPWPIIGNAWHFLGSKSDIIVKLKKYQNYKKLFAVWLGHELNVFINSPDFAEIYCKSNHLLHRTDKLKNLEFVAGKGLLLANGKDWKKAKKVVEASLPYSLVKNSIPLFQIQAEILTERLQSEVGKPCFPILYYAEAIAFDAISELTLGNEIKTRNKASDLLKNINLVLTLLSKRIYNVLHHWDFIYKLFPEGKRFYSEVYKLLNFLENSINDETKKFEDEGKKLINGEYFEKSKRTLFVQTLFDDEAVNLHERKDHIISVIIAGYKTVSTAISCALIMLALHPDIQEKAYKEIVSVIDTDFNSENVKALPYLEMVIKETFRLFPPIPLSFRKATGDIFFGDYLIPEGAEVSINLYELHRDPEQFDNPNQFNPDNFLPEKIAQRHPYSFIPFLKGLRNCVGGEFAMMVMKITIAKLLLNYNFECDYKTVDDVQFRGDISLHLRDKGLIRIFHRQ